MKHKIKDERIEYSKLLVYKMSVQILCYFLIVSIIFKALVRHQNFGEYRLELGCLVFIGMVIIAGNLLSGNYISISNEKLSFILATLLVGTLNTMMICINNYVMYQNKYSSIFDGLFLSSVIGNWIVQIIISGIIIYLVREQTFKK